MNDLISIIIPVYNCEKTIADAIKSVINQTYSNFECIVIDDFSTDATVVVIESFHSDKVKLVKLKANMGGSYARNVGIETSKGNLIMFLDSDDILLPNCLEKRLSNFDFSTDFTVYPNYGRFKNGSDNIQKVTQKSILLNNNLKTLKAFITHNLPLPWNIMGVLWKKEKLIALEGFNIKYLRMQDVELTIRAFIKNYQYKVINNDVDCLYRDTLNEKNVKIKRRNFYTASFTFISENSRLIDKISHPEKNKIKKYLFYFFLKTFMMTILSKEFDKKDSRLLFNIGQKNNLLNKSKRYLPFLIKLKPIIEIKIVRSLFWRFTNFYVNHK